MTPVPYRGIPLAISYFTDCVRLDSRGGCRYASASLPKLWWRGRREFAEGSGGSKRMGGVGGEAKDEISGDGARPGPDGGMDIEAEPYETANTAEPNFFGAQPGGVTGGNAGHFGEIVHGSELHVGGAGQLA